MSNELLSADEAAEYLNLDLRLFLDIVRDKNVPSVFEEGISKFNKEDLDAMKPALAEMKWMERRVYPRLDSLNLVSYSLIDENVSGEGARMARTIDMSLSGLKIETSRPFAPGDILRIELAMGDSIVVAKVRVVHATQLGRCSFDVGLCFTEISDSDRELLLKHLRRSGKVPPPLR